MKTPPFVEELASMALQAWQKGWHERNGGNLSYRLSTREARLLPAPASAWRPLGLSLPALAGESFLVTGQGKYMRTLGQEPAASCGVITLDSQGASYCLRWGLSQDGRPTSELPTHLMCQAAKKGGNAAERLIYHAHPANIIALSFVLPPSPAALSQALWSAMPECPMVFPEGVGVVPYTIPGGHAIARATAELMRTFNAVLWAQHGLLCAGANFEQTFGLMETVEKAAEIYVKVLSMGGPQYGPKKQELYEVNTSLNLGLNLDLLDR